MYQTGVMELILLIPKVRCLNSRRRFDAGWFNILILPSFQFSFGDEQDQLIVMTYRTNRG